MENYMISAINTNTIDSREISDMLEIRHQKLLEKLEGTKDGKLKGINNILTEHNFVFSDYFIPSTYKDNSGKENKCYLFTRLGCDFIANKFTGEKGILFTAKYVKKFHEMENQINQQSNTLQIPFKEQVECIDIIANSLRANDASKILMYSTLYKDYNLSTNFLPQYELNGSKDMKSATELLKRFDLGMTVIKFNALMKENGYLEERTRKSTVHINKIKKYNALTEKGLEYGENAVSTQCQREVQLLYYADSFKELFDSLTTKVGAVL